MTTEKALTTTEYGIEKATELKETHQWHRRGAKKLAQKSFGLMNKALERGLLNQAELNKADILARIVADSAKPLGLNLTPIDANEHREHIQDQYFDTLAKVDNTGQVRRNQSTPPLPYQEAFDGEEAFDVEEPKKPKGEGWVPDIVAHSGEVVRWRRPIYRTEVVFEGLPLRRYPLWGGPKEAIDAVYGLDDAPKLPEQVYAALEALEGYSCFPVQETKVVTLRQRRREGAVRDPILCVRIADQWFAVLRWE